ncbi:MAG: hypothetical protein WBA97_34350 [Actinophytocola sp.]|uniref:hypothetical protein n=1 Tax=Actinophytocola sp. TaxID=1872138 RepID=UPI003C7122EF
MGDTARWTCVVEGVVEAAYSTAIHIKDGRGSLRVLSTSDLSGGTVEVLERADDPTIGEIRTVGPTLDGKAKTAVKVGGRLSDTPGERSLWVIVETGEVLKDGNVTGLGEVIGTVRPDSPRPSVRVPNEPHGLSGRRRDELTRMAGDGNVHGAVHLLVVNTSMNIQEATDYVLSMSEYRTYLAAHGEKWDPRRFWPGSDGGIVPEPDADITAVDDKHGDRLRREGDGWIGAGGEGYPLIVKPWEDHVLPKYAPYTEVRDSSDVDPVEADRMRAMGFDAQPEFKVSDEDRALIASVLDERTTEYVYGQDDGSWKLDGSALSGVVADIVFAAIRRDRERGGR